MGAIGNSLKQALQKLAHSTSVEQLKKRGVKQVNVIGLDRVVSLIEESVHRALRHKLMGLDRERVAGATTAEFLRLLKSNEDLERLRDEALREKQMAEEQVDDLRRELKEQRQALRERLEVGERELRASYEGENQAILEKVNSVFSELTEHADGDLGGLRDRMIELVMNVVEGERESTLEAPQAARDREVDLMQRRIDKLARNLEETEQQLARVAELKDVDDGISSIYREVQGLSDEDAHFARKKDLMADIFKANLELQNKSASA